MGGFGFEGQDSSSTWRLSAVETNLMETPEGAPLQVQNDSAILDVKPYSINTIKVVFDGVGPGFWTTPATAWK